MSTNLLLSSLFFRCTAHLFRWITRFGYLTPILLLVLTLFVTWGVAFYYFIFNSGNLGMVGGFPISIVLYHHLKSKYFQWMVSMYNFYIGEHLDKHVKSLVVLVYYIYSILPQENQHILSVGT